MDEAQIASFVGQSSTARSVNLGPNKVTFLLGSTQTGGMFSLTEFEAAPPPAPGAPIHIHYDADETIYVLEGDWQVIIDDEATPVQAGSYVLVPRGTPHNIVNAGTTRGRILVVLSPPGFEGYWDEMSRLMAAAGGPVDPDVTLATQAKYHMDTQGQVRKFTDG